LLAVSREWCHVSVFFLRSQGYTEGPQPLNWKQILKDVVRKPDFYLDVDPETGERKDAGWVGLGMEEEEEEEAAEEESEYSEDDGGDDDESEEDSDVRRSLV
jgi:nucleosome binding factor SPN SPT16 subunit